MSAPQIEFEVELQVNIKKRVTLPADSKYDTIFGAAVDEIDADLVDQPILEYADTYLHAIKQGV